MIIHSVVIRHKRSHPGWTENKLYGNLSNAIEETVNDIIDYLIELRYDEPGRFNAGVVCYSKMKECILNNDYQEAYQYYLDFSGEVPDNNEEGFLHDTYTIFSQTVIE